MKRSKLTDRAACRMFSIFNPHISRLFLMVVLFCLITAWAYAENDAQNSQSDKKIPVHVVADKMIAARDNSTIEFIGDARVTRLEAVLLADSITVYFEKTDKDSASEGDIKKIVSKGRVRYTSGDKKAFSDMAVYTVDDDVLVLTGPSTRLATGKSFVKGKKITFRQQDKVVVESSGEQRVEALLDPEDQPADFTK